MKINIGLYKAALLLSVPLLAFGAPPEVGAEKLFESGAGFGLKVSMELRRAGTIKSVSPQTAFQSGDDVKLHLTSNFDGYVYVLGEGTSGSTSMLFPGSQAGTGNSVKSGQEFKIPETAGWFRVMGQPGVERLIVIASPHALGQLEQQYAQPGLQTSTVPAATPPPVAKPAAPLAIGASGTGNVAASPANRAGAPSAAVSSTNKQPTAMTTTRQNVQQVNQGISTGRQITSIPTGIVSIFKNVVPRDLVLEDSPEQGAAYVSANTKTLTDPVIFTVSIVHN